MRERKNKNKFLKHFKYFYNYLGYRVFLGLILNLVVGLLDGFGLALFMPILSKFSASDGIATESMGALSFITDTITFFGFDVTLNSLLVFIVFVFVFKGFAKYTESYYSVTVSNYFILQIRKEFVSKFAQYKYESFINADSGRIQNTLSGEVTRVSMAYNSYRTMLQGAVLILVYVTLAFLSNAHFAVMIALAGLLTNLIFHKLYKKTKSLSTKLTNYGHVYQGLLIQFVGFFKYLKATGRFESYSRKLHSVIEDVEVNNKKMGKINAFVNASREPIVIIIVINVIFLEVNYFDQVLSGLILSLLFFWRAMNSVLAVQTSWNSFLGVSASIKAVKDFNKELTINSDVPGKKIFEGLKNNIKLINFTFYYNQNSKTLNNISLTINRNQTVAFVGESGSGKTTLVNVLTGLVKGKEGEFKIDGVDFVDFEKSSFQKKVGYITQEPVIFADNIFNNVTFWDEPSEENLERFWNALEQASIKQFVSELPEQEKSLLGNNGVKVSGGQKQRISIARELYRNVEILIMDEATSALDSETEKSIQENIDALKGRITILIVAHRLSTIKNADNIVLMDKGEIQNMGNFQKLIEIDSNFKRMVDLQEL